MSRKENWVNLKLIRHSNVSSRKGNRLKLEIIKCLEAFVEKKID